VSEGRPDPILGGMDAIDLARWQFGITTVYHFLFVPITIGLSALVAGLHTAWYRTGQVKYRRMTQFWGKLFLINFAMGVVTGIVQEFQFGMNWSDYSKFVGDIFGAPLAIEGLLAFFLESTFLGLWIFGWDRLPKKVHLASIWLVAIGTQLSAYFILAANSWMQWPVGYRYDQASGRAELQDFGAVLTNKVALVTFPHTISAAFLTGGAFMLGIALWHLVRRKGEHTELFRPAVKLGAFTVLVASVAVVVTGDIQGKIMTETPADEDGRRGGAVRDVRAGGLLPADDRLAGRPARGVVADDPERPVVPGHRHLRRRGRGHQQSADRVRAALRTGLLQAEHPDHLLELPADDPVRRPRRADGPDSAVVHPPQEPVAFQVARPGGAGAAHPATAGQQPGLDLHRDGPPAVDRVRSDGDAGRRLPTVGAGTVLISLITFTLVYAVLAVIEVFLLARFARTVPAEPESEAGAPAPAFLY